MNKSVEYLDDGLVQIEDEFGNVNKRLNEDNIEEILAIENKLEHVKNHIKELKQCLFDYNCLGKKYNFIKKLIPVLIVAHVLTTYLIGATVTGIIVGTLSFSGMCYVIIGIANNKLKKAKNGINAELEFINSLQEEYQQELDEKLINSKVRYNDKILDNKIIPIKYYENLDEQVIEEINSVYSEAYNSKEKPFTRTRQKK
ncbi:MAG: hypothetical protein J6B98_03935 [Bacilli bacterium]|nr:hypothetical protein [Bacilli bacterium]